MNEVICYTIYGCPKCQKVLNYLEKKGIDVKEINIMDQPERAGEVLQLTGEVITPVLFYKTNFAVGDRFEDVDTLLGEIKHEKL